MQLLVSLIIILGLSACTKKTEPSSGSVSTESTVSENTTAPELKALIEKGRTVYAANCTSCHGAEPKNEGALGPALVGSSEELLEKRVLYGTYPENYKPKRLSKIMQPLPFLKGDIKALYAYINKK